MNAINSIQLSIHSLFFAVNLFESSLNINNSVVEIVCLIRGGAERRREIAGRANQPNNEQDRTT